MLDPTPIMFATAKTREYSRSAMPQSPRIPERPRKAARRSAPHPLATFLRRTADRLDARRGVPVPR